MYHGQTMINGIHTILYTRQAEELRAFFRYALGYPFVEVGPGWPIFLLPPTEMGVHPCGEGEEHHELYLMCDDLAATLADLEPKGVTIAEPAADKPWGRQATVRLPGGFEMNLYQPSHPIALGLAKP